MAQWPLLSVLIWLPILGAILVLVFGRDPRVARWLSVLVALATLLASIPLYLGYDAAVGGMQFVESSVWIDAIKAYYALGVDGISVALIVLTTFTSVLVVVGSWGPIDKRVSQYMAAMLALEGMLIGISSGAALAAVAMKLPELGERPRVLTFNYDTGERYLSVPDFLPEER